MKYQDVALVFDQLEKESKRLTITSLLASLLKKATPDEAAIISYLSLGSLNPPYITCQFNFAEKSLLKVIAVLLGKTQSDIKKERQQIGDFGLIVETGHWRGSSDSLSVKDIHKGLLQFLSITGTGSQEKKEDYLLKLLRSVMPLSAKYIVRVISGKLRLGFSDMTLIDSFSWMETGDKSIRKELEDAYNISADIGYIVKTLKEDGLKGIQKISITPGIPIRPAAAERMPDARSILKKLGDCIAQPKLDGFRLQVHLDKRKSEPTIRFFSRNLLDMSNMFPELVDALKDLPVKTLVAEGEAICFDEDTGSFMPFQETVKRKRKHGIEEMMLEYPLKLYFFDLLYLDGESYLDKTHTQRRKKLVSLLDNKKIKKERVIYSVDEKKITTPKELDTYFEENIAQGLEGLVVKKQDEKYRPGKRNFNWIKFKRQETGSLDDTLDCVILGYYFGHGKRAGFGIGALLVGIYNKAKDHFETIAKIGTGLSDSAWKDIKKRCDAIQVKKRPNNVECSKDVYPDVWVIPEVVCMIRADEITKSPQHKAGSTEKELGFALRFPRFMGYRPDKSPYEATEIKEVKRLYDLQFEKFYKKRREN